MPIFGGNLPEKLLFASEIDLIVEMLNIYEGKGPLNLFDPRNKTSNPCSLTKDCGITPKNSNKKQNYLVEGPLSVAISIDI